MIPYLFFLCTLKPRLSCVIYIFYISIFYHPALIDNIAFHVRKIKITQQLFRIIKGGLKVLYFKHDMIVFV